MTYTINEYLAFYNKKGKNRKNYKTCANVTNIC